MLWQERGAPTEGEITKSYLKETPCFILIYAVNLYANFGIREMGSDKGKCLRLVFTHPFGQVACIVPLYIFSSYTFNISTIEN